MRDVENFDVVKTGLVGQVANDVLNSVLGQLSDGIWENAPVERFWKYATIRDKDNAILVDRRYWRSGYFGKTDEQVREYFAKKVTQIVKIWKDDNPRDAENPESDVTYLSYDAKVTVSDAKAIAKALRHFTPIKKKVRIEDWF